MSDDKKTSTWDKVLHTLGAASAALLTVAATGGVAIPVWLSVAAGVVAVATGASSTPIFKR